MIIDSHCHLDYPNLYDQLFNVLNRAKRNNVDNLLTICTTLESFEKIKVIVNKYNNIYGTFGIHPHETKNFTDVNSDFIIKSIKNNNKIIGVGETGLDFYYNHSDKDVQKKSFISHIKAAAKLDIPVIVHSRNAEDETFEIIKKEMMNNKLRVLIHCFTGSSNFADKLLDIGCYISVSGIITFKNSNVLAETVASIPLDKLLVETDSPYLAPLPHRGKPNEPSYITHTVEKLAAIKKVDKEIVIKNTTKNFMNLFKLN
tara:strand:+ start:7495 stop:8268 length:774 start_codon:yes stop_codon:yes gene_type:complete